MKTETFKDARRLEFVRIFLNVFKEVQIYIKNVEIIHDLLYYILNQDI